VGVKLALLAGALLVAAGILVYLATGGAANGHAAPLALVLLGAGLVVAFPVAALLALLLGPTWAQRQRHLGLSRRIHQQ
jgi:dipeptide/tripeptide permease